VLPSKSNSYTVSSGADIVLRREASSAGVGVAQKAGGSGKVARPPRCIYSNFISSLNYWTITTMHTYVITLSALLTLSFFI
jgi:hypothetical protein